MADNIEGNWMSKAASAASTNGSLPPEEVIESVEAFLSIASKRVLKSIELDEAAAKLVALWTKNLMDS